MAGRALTRAIPVFNSFKLFGLTMFVFCTISFLVNMLFITRRLLFADCTLTRLICIYTEFFSWNVVDMNTTTQRGADQGASKLNAVISKLRKNLTNLGMNQRAINTKINELRSSSSLNKTAYANNIFKKAKASKARSNAAKAVKAVKAVKAPINTNTKKRNISNNRRCDVDGSKMYYKINDIANVTVNKTGGMEAKFLIDTLKAIRGQCFTVHQQCKGLYPVVSGKDQGRKWLTSIDQDNDISLQHTLDKSDIPILYNTPRFCDPGMTKSKNWSLKNYI